MLYNMKDITINTLKMQHKVEQRVMMIQLAVP